jgi:glycosyltransferase involved in cell wall biosynthesis
MIKVLYTIPNFDTAGSGKALLNIAVRLDRSRFVAEILCKHDRGAFFETVRSSGLKVHVFDYETPMRPLLGGLKGCWKVSRRFRSMDPDIIHSFHYSADYSEALASRMAGIPWVYTKKNMGWHGPSLNSWKMRTRLARHVLVQNTDMFGFFTGFPNDRFTLVPRGVNTSEFLPVHGQEAKRIKRRALHLDEDARQIVCVANLVPVKGVEVLIKAFGTLAEAHPGWNLLVVGENDSEYGRSLQALAATIGLEGRVLFTGKRQNVRDYLNASDVFVLPTLDEGRREGSPVSMLEAISSGLLVYGSRIAGIRDQLSEFPEHLFNPGDASDLSVKLARAMGMDDDQRAKVAQGVRDRVMSGFNIDVEVRRHEDVYTRVCGR